MDLSKYTERLKEILQAAQGLALRRSHQQLTPEHLLAALLEDGQGTITQLLKNMGLDPTSIITSVSGELDKQTKIEGTGAGQIYMAPETARVIDKAEQLAKTAGDNFVTVERLLQALTQATETPAGQILKRAGITQKKLAPAIEELRKGQKADTATAEERYEALKR